MIHTVSAEGFDLAPKLQRYTAGKVRDIEKFIPRQARQSAVLVVHFKEVRRGASKTCTLALQLPHQTLSASETTGHMYAALDITVVEIRRQLAEYKSKHSKRMLRHFFARRQQEQVGAR
jgi:ribosomal subunit interface protein